MSARSAHAATARAGALALLLLGGPGCADGPGGDAGTGASSSGGSEPPTLPNFSEPASGRLSFQTSRTDDITLAVEQITLGRTHLILDGHSFGPLDEDSLTGRLELDSLRLYLRGSMLSGQHTMRMRTTESAGVAESEEIIIDIISELAPVPTAVPPTPAGISAERLLPNGEGDDALLLALEPGADGFVLHLLPWTGSGWDPAGARTVALPGLALEPEERVLPVSARRHSRSEDSAGRVRVAWRVGLTGTRIDVLDVAWDDADPTVAPRTSLTLPEALDGRASEWAAFGRPWLLPDQLLVELWAPADTESPRPGDRAVVWSRVQPDAVALDPPQRVSVRADLVDIDRLGPVVDVIARERGGPPAVTIRVDQHQPLTLEADPVAGGLRARPTTVDGRDRSFSFVDMPLTTIHGAFGARTIAGITARSGGRMRVALIDDLGNGGVTDHSLAGDDVADDMRGLPAVDERPASERPVGGDRDVDDVAAGRHRVEVSHQAESVVLRIEPEAHGRGAELCRVADGIHQADDEYVDKDVAADLRRVELRAAGARDEQHRSDVERVEGRGMEIHPNLRLRRRELSLQGQHEPRGLRGEPRRLPGVGRPAGRRGRAGPVGGQHGRNREYARDGVDGRLAGLAQGFLTGSFGRIDFKGKAHIAALDDQAADHVGAHHVFPRVGIDDAGEGSHYLFARDLGHA